MRGWIEWPEVGTEDHDAEVDIVVVMILLHAFLELVSQIFTETHVCRPAHQREFASLQRALTSKHPL